MNDNNRDKSILPTIFLTIQIMLIIVVIAIVSMNTRDEEIGQTDYDRITYVPIKNIESELPDVPYFGPLQVVLTKTVELNSADFNPSDSPADIRDGSLKVVKFETINSVYFSAILDIPNLQQSYQVYALYPMDAEDANIASYNTQYVLCLGDNSEKIYPDFDCKDLFGSDVRRIIASDYLKYFDFDGFRVETDRNKPSSVRIVYSFGASEDDRQKSLQEVKDAIESLGVSADAFNYEFEESRENMMP